jgi:DNA-binding NarL/FixJ family response regulator
MRALRILIADDQEIVRVGLRSVFKVQPGLLVVAEAADGREAVEKAKTIKPDLVVLDTGMPTLNGVEAARQIIKRIPGVQILFFTTDDSDDLIQQSLEAGVRGFILKTDPTRDLLTAVQALRNRQAFFTPKVGQIVLDGFLKRRSLDGSSSSRLSARQREIVKLLAEGKTTKEVASLLNLSMRTAGTHRSNLMTRLHCHSVAELVRYCIRNQIIEVSREQIDQEELSMEKENAVSIPDSLLSIN